MIEKKINYIWFGKKEKPDIIKKCIASWKKYLPDYQIIEWNEKNYNINRSRYVADAYKCKQWAFASDYARFDILYNHGGIYLDTDVEFLKPLPDKFLENEAFTAFEYSGIVAPGLIFGATKGAKILKEIMSEYNKMTFINKPAKFVTVNSVVYKVLRKHGVVHKNQFQVISGLAIYPSKYFCGFNTDLHDFEIESDTISVHHYEIQSWNNHPTKNKFQIFLRNVIGKERYLWLLKLKRKLFGSISDNY